MGKGLDRSSSIKVFVLVIAMVVGLLAFGGVFSGSNRVSGAASGPSASHTDGPGEDNCTACHTSFPVNSGLGSVQISGIPPVYSPGQQIPITVTTSDSGPSASIFGFQITAIDRLGREAGTFTVPSQFPQKTQIVSGIVGGNSRKYVEHTADGLFTAGVFGSNSWSFTWTAPSSRIGKIGFYAAGNAGNGDGTNGGDYIYTTTSASLSGPAAANFDADTISDISVFRPSNGAWYSLRSTDGGFTAAQFGMNGDKIVPGDYDGDGNTDRAVFRPSTGTWYIDQSLAGFAAIKFGISSDIPVQGDFDGDRKTDLGVYRPSEGTWYLYQSSAGFTGVKFGLEGDKPVSGDFDSDGKTDLTVFRPSTGTWYSLQSSAGFGAVQFGISEDIPVPADYDGDGASDYAVFRTSTGVWYLLRSSDGFGGVQFGISTDIPSPGDFDGDGKTDVAVFRPSQAAWFGLKSVDGSLMFAVFGTAGDVPVPSGYVGH